MNICCGLPWAGPAGQTGRKQRRFSLQLQKVLQSMQPNTLSFIDLCSRRAGSTVSHSLTEATIQTLELFLLIGPLLWLLLFASTCTDPPQVGKQPRRAVVATTSRMHLLSRRLSWLTAPHAHERSAAARSSVTRQHLRQRDGHGRVRLVQVTRYVHTTHVASSRFTSALKHACICRSQST